MFRTTKVSSIPYRKPVVLRDSDTLEQVLALYSKVRPGSSFFVADKSLRLLGCFSMDSIAELLSPYISLLDADNLSILWKKILSKKISELNYEPACAVTSIEQSANSLFLQMLGRPHEPVAVVDEHNKIVGEIHLGDLLLHFSGLKKAEPALTGDLLNR